LSGLSETKEGLTCSYEVTTCDACLKCVYLFSGAVLLGFIAVLGNYIEKIKKERKN